MPEEISLKYHWTRCVNTPGTLFHGGDGDRRVGMIEKSIVGSHWLWFVNTEHPALNPYALVTLNGAAECPASAAVACENCYDAMRAGMWQGASGNRRAEPELLQRVATGSNSTRPTQATHLRVVK